MENTVTIPLEEYKQLLIRATKLECESSYERVENFKLRNRISELEKSGGTVEEERA